MEEDLSSSSQIKVRAALCDCAMDASPPPLLGGEGEEEGEDADPSVSSPPREGM